MKNPCKECIVTTMCEEACEKFKRYVEKRIDTADLDSRLVGHLCDRIKQGVCKLTDNDRGWKWASREVDML